MLKRKMNKGWCLCLKITISTSVLRLTKCLPLTAFRRTPSSFHNDNPESTEDVIKDVLEKALTCKKKAQYVP